MYPQHFKQFCWYSTHLSRLAWSALLYDNPKNLDKLIRCNLARKASVAVSKDNLTMAEAAIRKWTCNLETVAGVVSESSFQAKSHPSKVSHPGI